MEIPTRDETFSVTRMVARIDWVYVITMMPENRMCKLWSR